MSLFYWVPTTGEVAFNPSLSHQEGAKYLMDLKWEPPPFHAALNLINWLNVPL